ncbi:flavin reductase family protein [Megalodesulfovibrio paquesii]
MKISLGPKPMLFPTPLVMIGSYDEQGRPNAMAAAWAGICCSKPPCVTVSLRKATYTYGNLMARKAYTMHVTDETHMTQSDYMGMISGRDTDKFEALGLTTARSELVDAPILQEYPLVLECKVVHVHELGLHTMFVGEVLDIKADPRILDEKNHPVVEQLRPLAFMPEVRTYHGMGPALGRAFNVGKVHLPEKFDPDTLHTPEKHVKKD